MKVFARLAPALAIAVAAHAQTPARLDLVATIPMPGVKGRIDHFAADPKGHRIFVAALGNDTVEVVDVEAKRVRSLGGFGEPQGVAFIAQSDRLFVANGQGNRVDLLDASSFSGLGAIEALDDADNIRRDEASRTVVVGYGKGALAILDEKDGHLIGRIDLPGHPESFQLERRGTRVFVNVPRARKVVVADRAKRAVVASWDLPLAAGNFPMALDEDGRRLFVGVRFPAALLVYDIDSGKLRAKVSVGGDTDDLFFDAAAKRIYVICGEGRVDVVREDAPDRYTVERSIETARGARTGLFVPEEARLYVAAPAADGTPARILVYALR